MFGFIYFIVIGAMLIYSAFEYQELRKRSRNDAMKRGHLDYVDYKGRQWYGDRRAVYIYKDGKEALVDAKDHNIVYIDITEEKELEKEKSSWEHFDSTIKRIDEAKMRCNGTIRYNTVGDYLFEITSRKPIDLYKKNNKCYLQYKRKYEYGWGNDGKEIEISKKKYDYLKGKVWDGDSKDAFLQRKEFIEENKFDIKFWGEKKNGYEIDYAVKYHYKKTEDHKQIFLCASTSEEAKQLFMDHWYKYCSCIIDDSITATEIELAE